MTELDFFSIDRVAQYLDSQDYSYLTDKDGDIYAIFNGINFFFSSTGSIREILLIRGFWQEEAPVEAEDTLLHFINSWHKQKFFPRIDVTITEDDTIEVGAEISTLLEVGVTDEQLAAFVDQGLSYIVNFFEALDDLEIPGTFASKRSTQWP